MHEEMTITTTDVDKPEPTERRKALVNQWLARIKHAKEFHKKAFKTMKRDMDAALNGFEETKWSERKLCSQHFTATCATKNGTIVR